MFVLGMGESKTPLALTRACNRFIHLNLVAEQNKALEGNENLEGSEEQNVTSITEVRQAILALVNENDGKQVDLARIGSRLNDKFSDFDVRNYGYAKLSTMVVQEVPDLAVKKVNNQHYVERRTTLTKAELEREICSMIEKSGGMIDNLSTLNDELHKKYRQLDFRQFGYSRISSFLRSMKSVTVHENQVTLREEAR